MRKRIAAVCGSLIVLAVVAQGSPALANTLFQRFAGSDRYATAEDQARHIAQNSRYVIASGQNFGGGLIANFLAGSLQSRLLLTDNNNLSSATRGDLENSNDCKEQIYVVDTGGQIAGGVIDQLRQIGGAQCAPTVTVVDGGDAYATAAQIAGYPGTTVGTFPGLGRTAIIASGARFPDALAASPLAYQEHLPLLLTNADSLPAASSKALKDLGIRSVLLMGGTAAVSQGVQGQISAMGISVTRIAGADRQTTATKMADLELSKLGWATDQVLLARGDDYPDALAAGQLAGKFTTPIVLTASPADLSQSTRSWLTAHRLSICGLVSALGGTAAISDATWTAAETAAHC